MEPRAKKQKRQYPSQAQKTRLAQLLKADAELRSGKFTSSFTKKSATARWDKIAVEVNSITGAKKSARDWRSTWIDMKSYLKKKYAGQKRSIAKKGGGPPDDSTFQNSGDIILGAISESTLAGHSDSQESMVSLVDFEPGIPEIEVLQEDVGFKTNVAETEAIQNETEPQPSMSSHKRPYQAKKTKRMVAQKRLQNSLDMAQTLHQITENIKIKKEFNAAYLQEMRRHSDAILELASSVRSLRDTKIYKNI